MKETVCPKSKEERNGGAVDWPFYYVPFIMLCNRYLMFGEFSLNKMKIAFMAYTQPKWSNKVGILDLWLSVYSSSTSFFLA